MANYQNYQANAVGNVDTNQEMNQNNAAMFNNLFMQQMGEVNKAQPNANANNTNNNNLVYTIAPNAFNFTQQNGFQHPYFNGLQGVSLVNVGNAGHPLGVYMNNQNQLVPNQDGYVNVMPQFFQMPNLNQGMMQVDVNELNKNMSQRGTPLRIPKKEYIEDRQDHNNGEIEYDHKNRPLIYSCKECPRRFSMNSRLLTHMRCHNGERPHVCHECNFAFTQKSYLVRHAAVHKEERPYQCVACKKTYKHYGSLANHRKTHKNGHKDVHHDDMMDNGKIEPECAMGENTSFQNQQYLFSAHEMKEEPQQAFMPTDLSTNIFPSTDHSGGIYTSTDHSANIFPSTDLSTSLYQTTDHSTNVFTSSDHTSNIFPTTEAGQSFMEQLNQYSQQNTVFYENPVQQEGVVSTQPSSNVATSNFSV